MKRLIYIAACALMVMTACQKDLLSPINDGSNQRTDFSVLANLNTFENDSDMSSADIDSDAATKAVANAVVRLNWAAGDKISAINLTTGKALGGDLVAQESGASSLFSGTLVGTINRGDRIAFLYPSQGYTEEQEFSGATIDLSQQDGSSAVPLAVYGTASMTGNEAQNMSIEFKYLMSYYQINLTDLPASSAIESVRFPAVGAMTTLTINDAKDGFESTAKDGAVTVKSSKLSTNAKGVKAVYISGFASTSKPSRGVEVMMDGFGYSTTWSGAALNVGRYYAAVVTDFKDEVAFEDANFEAYCLENFDSNHDGKISKTEAFAVTSMDFNSDNIESVVGIRSFKNLEFLIVQGSAAKWSRDGMSWTTTGYSSELNDLPVVKGTSATGKIKSMDLSGLSRLLVLDVSKNRIEELILDGCTSLTRLTSSYTCLASLDVSSNTALTSLVCDRNLLTSLDVSNNTALTFLECDCNQLTSLDVSKNTVLGSLWCQDNQLTSLDVLNNTALTYLHCNINQLTSLDVSNNILLTNLGCYSNQLTSLDVSNNAKLWTLLCETNRLSSLDVSNCTALRNLLCDGNQLTSLDVSKNTALTELGCGSNQIGTLDVSKNTALTNLWCNTNQLMSLDVSKNTSLTSLACGSNRLASLDLSKNTALTVLSCDNNHLASLDLSKNTALTELYCERNRLTSLDVSKTDLGNSSSTYPLDCHGNSGLQTLKLHRGWQIQGINVERSTWYIPAGTSIIYDESTTDTDPIEEL